jgi:hypothetical protein
MENKYEHIKFIIQRFDHYYDTVNSKGSFFIGLNTFILGGVCAGYITLYQSLHPGFFIWTFLVLLIVSSILSTILTIAAIQPYSKDNHANTDTPSLMYFGGIARFELTFLKQKFHEQTSERIDDDAIEQMHSLAIGLKGKFNKLKIASYFLILQIFMLIPLFFFIIKNLK